MDDVGDEPEATNPLTRNSLRKFKQDDAGYTAALEAGYHALIRKFWEREEPLRQTVEGTQYAMFAHVMTLVLATIPTCLLREVIAGNLAYAHLGQKKPDVVKVVNTYNSPWVLNNVTVVYEITLASPSGRSPKAMQWLDICDLWEVYKDHDTTDEKKVKLAFDVDSIGHPQQDMTRVKHGARRYIPPDSEDRRAPNMFMPAQVRYQHLKPTDKGILRLDEFFGARKIRALQASPHERLAVTYGGYSKNASARWKKHNDNPTNTPMGASRAFAQYLFPGDHFDLQSYVIAPVAAEEEAPAAELLVVGLGQSYYKSAYGFSIADAGESNTSIFDLKPKQRISTWGWTQRCSPRHANLKLQNELLVDRCRRQATQLEQIKSIIAQHQCEIDNIQTQWQQDEDAILTLEAQSVGRETQLLWSHVLLNGVLVLRLKIGTSIYEGDLHALRETQQDVAVYQQTVG